MPSPRFRIWFLVSFATPTIVVVAVSVYLILWPWWQAYLAGKRPIPWQPYSVELFEQLRGEHKTMLITVKADWIMWSVAHVHHMDCVQIRRALHSNNVVPVIADFTNDSPEVRALLEVFGNNGYSIPFTVLVPADPIRDPTIFEVGFSSVTEIDSLLRAIEKSW